MGPKAKSENEVADDTGGESTEVEGKEKDKVDAGSDSEESEGFVKLTKAEAEALKAAKVKLANLEAAETARLEKEALERGEHTEVIANLKAQLAEKEEELALSAVHKGFATPEARIVARALYSALPKEEQEKLTLVATVKEWAQDSSKAPAGIQAYLQSERTSNSPRGSSQKVPSSSADRAKALEEMQRMGFPPEDEDYFVKNIWPTRKKKLNSSK